MKKETLTHPWVLLLIVASLVAAIGFGGSLRLRRTLERALRRELETTLRANTEALEIWMTNQVRLATSLAADPALHAEFEAFTHPSSGPEAQATPGRFGHVADDLGRYLHSRLAALGCDGTVVSTNSTVVAASGRGRGRVGRPILDAHRPQFDRLFATGDPVLMIPFRPASVARQQNGRSQAGPGPRGGPFWAGGGPPADLLLMQIAVPIRNDAGTIQGALALVIDPEREFTRILSVSRLGESGDTYAFDQAGRLLSRSRFESQLQHLGLLTNRSGSSSLLNLRLTDPGGDLASSPGPSQDGSSERPLMALVAAAVSGGIGVNTTPTRDYRGVPVVGAWRWLHPFGFGLVVQQDATEAYQSLRALRRLFLLLVLLLVVTAIGLLLFSRAHVVLRRKLNDAELKAHALGQYWLEEKIGEGGMGVVYRARHALMRRPTAIKLLLPDRATPATIQQFEREVQLTSQLTHPNTIQIYDYGYTPDGMFYYVMEYLEGLNLRDLVTTYGPLPESRVIYLLNQVCDALHEAHQRGIVHRDIKPANILLVHRGGIPDSVKVVDFGLVREYHPQDQAPAASTDDQTPAGTPLFMSPESFRTPGSADPRSDIYSVGALGYYLATGHYVFEDESVEVILRRHMEDLPPSPRNRTLNPVTPELETAILRCLEKTPDRRPKSVLDLQALLAASPHAAEWNAEARAAWWTRFNPTKKSAGPQTHEIGNEELLATVRVGLATRQIAVEVSPEWQSVKP